MARHVHALNRRIASHAGTRQIELLDHADALADAADELVRRSWSWLWWKLARTDDWTRRAEVVYRWWADLNRELHLGLADGMTRLSHWAHGHTARSLADTLPLGYLAAAAAGRMAPLGAVPSVGGPGGLHPPGFFSETEYGRRDGDLPDVRENAYAGGRGYEPRRPGRAGGGLSVPRRTPLRIRGVSAPEQAASDGIRQLTEAGLASISFRDGAFQVEDYLAQLRTGEVSDDEARALFQQLLFPPPSRERVDQIVFADTAAGTWTERLAAVTKLADPARLAPVIAGGYAAGLNHREIAQQILPLVDNVKASARRIARTEGMRVAHEVQMDANAGVDDLTTGFQLHATLDVVTRPSHRARHGVIFYRQPDGSFLAPEPVPYEGGTSREMPHPPMEPNGKPAFN